MHEIYELKEQLMKELEEYGRKGEMTAGSLEVVDKLAHTIKNLCKIIEAAEEEGEYSMAGGSYAYARGGGQGGGRGQGGGMGGQSSRRSYEGGGSYARGRGRNARRDSRGRYSSEGGYSGNEEMVSQLEELMEEAPDQIRQDIQRLISKVENM